MNEAKRDLLLIAKETKTSDKAIEEEVASLVAMLAVVETDEHFCTAHELVTRYYISQNATRILRAISKKRMKPFYFLLNKN